MSNTSPLPVEMFTSAEIYSILREFNPWWENRRFPDLPRWKRAAFVPLMKWLSEPPTHRAIMLAGARRVGKTTLLRQAVEQLIKAGVTAGQVLYATFDHPLLKLAGLERVLKVWREHQPVAEGLEYLFLDEIQTIPDWQTWIKHQTDFHKQRRIAATGSAMPLASAQQESAVGRWHTIKLPTLSFAEYLEIRQTELPPGLPELWSLAELRTWTNAEFTKVGELARPLVAHFHEYLLRGGFPETAQVASIHTAQTLLREDIVDKVLKRDMTAVYGVRRVLELERMFLYLCLHNGGILSIQSASSDLGVSTQTVGNFIELFEACNLIYKLRPFGYGKEILRSRYKVYLADAAISGAVLLKGRSVLENTAALGAVVETAFFKHVFTHFSMSNVAFAFWKGKKDEEVDIVAEYLGHLFAFEVKYSQQNVRGADLKGMMQLCGDRDVHRAYVITREMSDFGPMILKADGAETCVMRVPAPLACYWLSRLEIDAHDE